MEIAKLVLEYLKVMAWPLVVLFLALKFRPSIIRILNAVPDRLASAENVKFGVFGQEVEISGTAKELQAVGQELLAASAEDQNAQAKASRILQAIPQLNNPVADIVGIDLLSAPRDGLTVDEMLETVLVALIPQKDREHFQAEQGRFILMSMVREVDKVLAQLTELDFVNFMNERYLLTDPGRSFFKKVAVREERLLSRFMGKTLGR